MGYMSIHCGNCGNGWEIHEGDNWNDDKARECPYCCNKIDFQTWNREVIPAFGSVADANRELFKNHTGYNETLFRFDVISDPIILQEENNMSTAEVRKEIETGWVALDSSRHELIELTSLVELIADVLTSDDEVTEAAVDGMFVLRRELQRISDDMGEIAADWQQSAL